MRKTQTLEHLALFLESAKIDFDSLTVLYKNHPQYEKSREFEFSEYERAYKDNFLKFQIERARNIGFNIQDYVLQSKRPLEWQYDNLRRVHVFKTKWCEKIDEEDAEFVLTEKERILIPLATYENLLKIEGVPYLVESCMGRFTPLKRIDFQIRLLNNLIKKNRFGYLIYSPEEYLIAKTTKKFQQYGGIIARFPLSKQEFREQLKETIDKNEFPLKEEVLNSPSPQQHPSSSAIPQFFS